MFVQSDSLLLTNLNLIVITRPSSLVIYSKEGIKLQFLFVYYIINCNKYPTLTLSASLTSLNCINQNVSKTRKTGIKGLSRAHMNLTLDQPVNRGLNS